MIPVIFGIGTDIVEVRRFEKWLNTAGMLERFFHPDEIPEGGSAASKCQHLAARFAAKEALSKAIGTGINGFDLRDVCVRKDRNGKPELHLYKSAAALAEKRCGRCNVYVSLSHEKEYALAFVIIETQPDDFCISKAQRD